MVDDPASFEEPASEYWDQISVPSQCGETVGAWHEHPELGAEAAIAVMDQGIIRQLQFPTRKPGHCEAKIDADGIALARDEHGVITRVAISLSDPLVEDAPIEWLTDYFVLQAHDAHET